MIFRRDNADETWVPVTPLFLGLAVELFDEGPELPVAVRWADVTTQTGA